MIVTVGAQVRHRPTSRVRKLTSSRAAVATRPLPVDYRSLPAVPDALHTTGPGARGAARPAFPWRRSPSRPAPHRAAADRRAGDSSATRRRRSGRHFEADRPLGESDLGRPRRLTQFGWGHERQERAAHQPPRRTECVGVGPVADAEAGELVDHGAELPPARHCTVATRDSNLEQLLPRSATSSLQTRCHVHVLCMHAERAGSRRARRSPCGSGPPSRGSWPVAPAVPYLPARRDRGNADGAGRPRPNPATSDGHVVGERRDRGTRRGTCSSLTLRFSLQSWPTSGAMASGSANDFGVRPWPRPTCSGSRLRRCCGGTRPTGA